MTIVQRNIKYLRKKHGLSRQEMADAIDIAAITIKSYETGRTVPRYNIADKISKHFNISTADLYKSDLSKPQPANNIATLKREVSRLTSELKRKDQLIARMRRKV